MVIFRAACCFNSGSFALVYYVAVEHFIGSVFIDEGVGQIFR